ncbi:MAG: hypothetical protein V4596_12955 [Bdellovibrionota bacterium]
MELLDLVEARTPKNEGGFSEKGWSVVESNQDVDIQIQRAFARYKRYISQGGDYEAGLKHFDLILEQMEKALKIMKPIGKQAELFFPGDAELKFKSKGSKEIGIALWDTDFNGEEVLWYDSNYFNKMNNTHKAALMVHEAIYKAARLRGDKNSKFARRMVGYLFSNEDEKKAGVDLSDDRVTMSFNWISGVQCDAKINVFKDKEIIKTLEVSPENSKVEFIVNVKDLLKDGEVQVSTEMSRYFLPEKNTAEPAKLRLPCVLDLKYVHTSSGIRIRSGTVTLSKEQLRQPKEIFEHQYHYSGKAPEHIAKENYEKSFRNIQFQWNSGESQSYGFFGEYSYVRKKELFGARTYDIDVVYQPFHDYPAEMNFYD